MSVAATADTRPDRRSLQFLEDYCPRCNPLGHNADSHIRAATLTEPTSVTRYGHKGALCEYQCARCGHCWQRADLWTAKQAGLPAA